jgi:homoserine dehydrogenase
MKAANDKGATLRYVARISREQVSVGIEELSRSSPLGRLRGTDNQVSLTTARYASNPLIVTGPGAGAEVTAAGVLNDIITIANSQEFEGRT